MLTDTVVACPYCGESFETAIDTSSGSQDYVEDCYVCCRPIEFRLMIDGQGHYTLDTRRDDD